MKATAPFDLLGSNGTGFKKRTRGGGSSPRLSPIRWFGRFATTLTLAFLVWPEPVAADIFINSRLTLVRPDTVAVDDNNVAVFDTKPKQDNNSQFGAPPVSFDEMASAPGTQSSARATAAANVNFTVDASLRTLSITASGSSSAFAERIPAQGAGSRRGIGDGNSTIMQLSISTTLPCDFTVSGQVNAARDVNSSTSASADVAISQGGTFIFRTTARGNETKNLAGTGVLPAGNYTIVINALTKVTASEVSQLGGSASASVVDCRIDLVTQGVPPPPPSSSVEWDNSAGGAFNNPANWDPQTVPGVTNTAVFGLQEFYTVNVGSAATSRLEVRNGSLTFTNLNYSVDDITFDPPSILLNNASLVLASGQLRGVHALIGESAASRVEVNAGATWTNSGSLRVGGPGEGILAIADGGVVTSAEGRIATGVGGGDVILAGFLAEWNSGNLAVGFSGAGTLTISDGALVTSGKGVVGLESGASGMVSIEGASPAGDPSEWECTELVVGEAGAGKVTVGNGGELFLTGKTTVNDTLLIENGGRSVHNSQPLVIGEVGIGEVSVRGVNAGGVNASMTSVGDFTIGQARAGFLTIADGGSARGTGGARIGVGAAGEVFVKGSETSRSRWDLEADLSVGVNNNGQVDIVDGGAVSARDVIVGVNPLSVGNITVGERSTLAKSSLLAAGRLFVGLEGSGTLIIEEGGLVGCAQAAVGGFANSEGIVELGVTGATGEIASWVIDGNLTVGGDAPGRILLRNGAIVSVGRLAGQLTVLPNGVIEGVGILFAPVRLVQNGGIIAPGLSPGTLTIDANYEQTSSGKLQVQAAGLGAGQFDQLRVTGDAMLGGTLEVTFLDGYLPKAGDTLAFLDIAGSVTGQFAEVVFPQLAPGFEIKTEMVDGKFQLTALSDAVRLFGKGISRGLLNGDPAGHDAAGFFTIRTNARGGFSARFVLGGQRFTFKGKFEGGAFSQTIPRPGDTPLTVTLEPSASDPRLITGTITDGASTIPIAADRTNAFNAKTNPAPQAGKYTALLEFDPAVSDAPQANGVGTVVISRSGAIRFAGALPDGTRLSQGTVLSASGEWPLYVLLYKKQGALFGELQFRDQPGSDFDGTLRWSRPPTPADKIQTAGFLATLPTIGSRYVAPPARPAVLDLPNGATATLSDAALTPALTKSLTLTPPNKFVVTDPGPDKFSLRAKVSNGQLSGRFIHPTTGLSTTVQGVVFQKQNLGSGFFLRPGAIGSFELQARP